MIQIEKVIDFHTFSITARDRETGAFGVAVATARPNVGSLVPWVSPRGAIATQARVNTDLGRQGIALLTQGVPVDVALSALLRKDGDRELRQVHAVDSDRAFCHTGVSCVPWCGHELADEFTIAGNMLAGPDVIAAMAVHFARVPTAAISRIVFCWRWRPARRQAETSAANNQRHFWWPRFASHACTTTFASTITPTRSPS
jgi:uncharacterized Ntn-hydrolase superfamily protein